MNSINFGNLIIDGLRKNEIIDLFNEKNGFTHLTTVNAEFIVLANQNKRFKNIVNQSIATIDGQLPYLIARLKNRGVKFEKISGADLIYDVIEVSKNKDLKIFFLGDTKEVNSKAVEVLKNQYKINVDGYSPPFQPYPFDDETNDRILQRIESFKPHFVIVGFGAPKQEFWINDHQRRLEKIGVNWAMGLGGTFRFISRYENRAPKIISNLGMEWIWRLLQNPKRFKRLYKSLRFFRYV